MPFQIFDAPPQKINASEALLGGLNQLMQNYEMGQETQAQNTALQRLGLSPEVARAAQGNPKILEALIGGQIKQQEKNANSFEDVKSYETIKNQFGKKFADVWQASPIGGRTELIKAAFQANERGFDIDQMLGNISESQINKFAEETKENQIKQAPPLIHGKIPTDYEWPQFDSRPQGYTAKEWIDTKKTWRKENAPVFEENKSRIKNTKRDLLGVKSLDKLNKTRKVGEGFQGTLINPETGDFYGVAQASGLVSPEGQQWVKEIARFQNRAKDAFGSRVTNFDLQSYMKQFPGLLNTYEGRSRILEMMKINYELDNLHDMALQQIYDHYGLAGIPQEKADELARSFIKEDTAKLEAKFLGLDQQNEREEQNAIKEMPPAEQNSGRKIRDKTTGTVYQSDGKEWRPVK